MQNNRPWVCVCAVPHFSSCLSCVSLPPSSRSSSRPSSYCMAKLHSFQRILIAQPLKKQTSIQTTTARQTSQHRLHETTASAPSIIIIASLLSIRSLLRIIPRLSLHSISLLPIIAPLLLIHLRARRIISSLSSRRVGPLRTAVRLSGFLVGRCTVVF